MIAAVDMLDVSMLSMTFGPKSVASTHCSLANLAGGL